MSTTEQPGFLSPDAFSLKGRHILVTGAGRGLGQSMALTAAAFGAQVTAVARSADQLQTTADAAVDLPGSVRSVPADVSDLAGLEGLAEDAYAHAPVYGVIHAAGVQRRLDAVDVTPELWREVLTLNLDAPFFLSQAIAKRQIAAATPGSHIFIGSLNSSIGLPRNVPYVASKTGLLGVTRALSTEWSSYSIRANAIGPGYYRTALTEGLLSSQADHDRLMARIPMRRFGLPEELGGAIAFLLSDASAYVSGQILNVDGGWLSS
ncbi:MAG: SDR family NAD(P)-dependent oxidoreductase [Brevibacterium yomogidense]